MTTNYISIKSVLYDLSLIIEDRYWNEISVLEWANKAARLIRSDQTLETKVTYLPVVLHKAELPSDLKYLTQIAYTDNLCLSNSCLEDTLNLPENSELMQNMSVTNNVFPWKAMRLTSNPYHASICLDKSIMHCTDCQHEFSVNSELVLTTTLKSGVIMVSYLGYPTDDEGYLVIPDNEELKEAILHYVLYRYWLSKYTMMEEGAEGRMKHHLTLWNTLSKKAAGNLNLPDINELENIKNQFNRLVPRENRFQQLFLTLGNRENVNF